MKGLKILFYIFAAAIITLIVTLTMKEIGTIGNVLKFISIGIVSLIGLVVIYLFIFALIDGKKIGKYLDTEDYEKLIAHCNKKIAAKTLLLKERKSYYKYLLIMAYVSIDDANNIIKAYSDFEGSDEFPATYYWRACFDFQRGEYRFINEYKDLFTSNIKVNQNRKMYNNQLLMFDILDEYLKGNKEKAKTMLDKLDMSHISMPCTLRTIDIIKNNQEEVIDEVQ